MRPYQNLVAGLPPAETKPTRPYGDTLVCQPSAGTEIHGPDCTVEAEVFMYFSYLAKMCLRMATLVYQGRR